MKHIYIRNIDIANNMSTEQYTQYKFHEIYIKKGTSHFDELTQHLYIHSWKTYHIEIQICIHDNNIYENL